MADDLGHMVEINTHVYNTEGANTLGNWLSRRLAKLNFQRQVFPQVEVGNILYFSNHQGEQNDILVLGHLDTIYGYQDYVPFREERGRFYGSGIAESKGGLAIMLGALQALRFTRRLKRIRCGILLITDDTLGGRFSKKLVQDFAGRSNFVIGLKYGETSGGIVTSCSGGAEYHFELTNQKGVQTTDAPDVVKTICQKVITWQKLSSEEAGIMVKPAKLEAHTSYGLSPDYATGSLLVRFKEKEQGERLDSQIRQIARRGLGSKFQVRVRKRVYRPPLQENDNIRKFFNHVQQIAKRLEVKVTPVHRTTSSDICYVPNDKPALEGLGPIGGSSNSPNEFIVRDSLIDRAAVLAMVIRLSTEEL
jgi:D-alanine-D-alanine ligase